MVPVRGFPWRAGQLLSHCLAVSLRSTLPRLLCLLVLSACSPSTITFVRPPAPVEDNTLGPGDVFGVRVFGEQDMSQEYRVSPDGTIDFPFVGRVRVMGMDPNRVADEIRTQLREREILVNPQVSVYIREFNSRRINVIGQVQRPGTFPFEQNMNIVQAISIAGGFTPIADQGSVRLTRKLRGGGQRSYVIPVDLIAQGRTGNVSMAPGDIIFVPERPF